MSTEPSSEDWRAKPHPPQGAPCWIEIMSAEPTKLWEFYTALFPAWTFKATTEPGTESATQVVMYSFEQPSGLSGGIVKLPEGCTVGEQPMGAGFTVYYFVDSIDEIEKKIVELGGKKVLEKTPQSTHGWFANFKDPEGNRFGVFEANWGGAASA